MGLWELFVIAFGLSMDAFAVAVCKGLAVKKAGISRSAYYKYKDHVFDFNQMQGVLTDEQIEKLDRMIENKLSEIKGKLYSKDALKVEYETKSKELNALKSRGHELESQIEEVKKFIAKQ